MNLSSLTLGMGFLGLINSATQQHLTEPGLGSLCNVIGIEEAAMAPLFLWYLTSRRAALTMSLCDSSGKPGLIHTGTHQRQLAECHPRLL